MRLSKNREYRCRRRSVDKSLQDLHNSSYHMKADQCYCYYFICIIIFFIIHSKYFLVLNILTSF